MSFKRVGGPNHNSPTPCPCRLPTTKKYFLLTVSKYMGYDVFFQKCARQLLLSILISMESPLQILIFEIFIFYFFYQFCP